LRPSQDGYKKNTQYHIRFSKPAQWPGNWDCGSLCSNRFQSLLNGLIIETVQKTRKLVPVFKACSMAWLLRPKPPDVAAVVLQKRFQSLLSGLIIETEPSPIFIGAKKSFQSPLNGLIIETSQQADHQVF